MEAENERKREEKKSRLVYTKSLSLYRDNIKFIIDVRSECEKSGNKARKRKKELHNPLPVYCSNSNIAILYIMNNNFTIIFAPQPEKFITSEIFARFNMKFAGNCYFLSKFIVLATEKGVEHYLLYSSRNVIPKARGGRQGRGGIA